MDYRIFGRTGLSVSTAGIGTGGASRLGLSNGGTEEQAIAVIHRALDLGINYFDTAEGYHTEDVVGRALEGHRDEIVISSKIAPSHADGTMLDRAGLRRALETALGLLRTEMVDVYHLHRPSLEQYDYCLAELVPELEALRDEGKLRFIAISESTSADGEHTMLHRAVQDDCWDVIMTAFNLFNQRARTEVFPLTIEKDIAVEIMGAARVRSAVPISSAPRWPASSLRGRSTPSVSTRSSRSPRSPGRRRSSRSPRLPTASLPTSRE